MEYLPFSIPAPTLCPICHTNCSRQGLDPFMFYGICTAGCMGIGFLFGPTVGTALWRLTHKSKVRRLAFNTLPRSVDLLRRTAGEMPCLSFLASETRSRPDSTKLAHSYPSLMPATANSSSTSLATVSPQSCRARRSQFRITTVRSWVPALTACCRRWRCVIT